MPRDLIRLSLQLPEIPPGMLKIAIIAGVVLLLLIVIFIVLRSRRNNRREEHMRDELVAMEREAQFLYAAEQSQYLKSSLEVAQDIESLFRDYVFLTVLAIYVGRQGHEQFSNALAESGSSGGSNMPGSLPASRIIELGNHKMIGLAALTGVRKSYSSGDESAPDTNPLEDIAVSAGQRQAAASQESGMSFSGSGFDTAEQVIALPWRGPFGWQGLIVARPKESVTADTLDHYNEPVSRLGDRLAVALEMEHQQTELDRASESSSRAITFSRAVIAALKEESPLESIAREAASFTGASSVAVWLAEPDESIYKMAASSGLRSAEFLPLPAGQGLAGNVAKTGEPLMLEDAPSDPRCLFPREARESGICSYLGVPIISDGRTVGVLEAHTPDPRAWTQSEARTLEFIASLIPLAMVGARPKGSSLEAESAYFGLSEAMQQLHSPNEILEAVVEVLGHALNVSRAIVIEFGEGGQPAPVRYEYRDPAVSPAAGTVFSQDMYQLISAAIANNESLAIADSREQSLMNNETASKLGVMSELAVPIRFQGQTRAVIHLHQCDRLRDWQPEEVEFASRVSRQLSLSLANIQTLATAARNVEAARRAEAAARAMAEQSSAEAGSAQVAELQNELTRLREEETQVRQSAQQLLEINRLKSEFIVNAGRELEASLQSVMGFAELLNQGSYGQLSVEQQQAVRSLYAWARRMKNDVDWMVEYGSARSRRLDKGEEDQSAQQSKQSKHAS